MPPHRSGISESCSGLHGEIKRLRDGHRATCDTIATQQRQAGTFAVVVLGGLLEEAERMAGNCSAALERSRIAGLVCEATYAVLISGGRVAKRDVTA